MPQENVEIVRRVYAAYADRDYASSFALYAPDIEYDISHLGDFGIARIYRGHEGVRACFRDLLDAFATFEFTVEDLVNRHGQVLALVREYGVGRTSGVIVDRHHYAVWSLRGGKIERMRAYLSAHEAERAIQTE